jgi:cytochrome c oxidase subunit 2
MIPLFPIFPQAASTMAPKVDAVTWSLLAATGFMLFMVFAFITFFAIRYRKGSPHSRKVVWGGKHMLEWGWTFATFGIFVAIFAWAAVLYFEQHLPPAGAAEITVIGKQWMWKFQHPSGKREINELHVPVGEPILLTLTSQDVIHSFFVPAFRIKQDVLPDRYVHVWFQATKPGTYHLFCTQYCGTMHSEMRGKIIVMPQQDYQNWIQTGLAAGVSDVEPRGTLSMAARGRDLFTRLGCISCHGHAPNLAAGVRAPNLEGLFGSQVALSDGTYVKADENYLRESILNPQAKITMGYPNIMPSFAKTTSEEDLLDLIAYIKSLRGTP